MLSKKVWLFFIFITGMLCTSCVLETQKSQPVSKIPIEQDTLKMEPDFSYDVTNQQPHIRVDKTGYQNKDKKVAFFYGIELEETFEVRDEKTDIIIYTGTLSPIRDEEGRTLYYGVFSGLEDSGTYYIHQKQIGDSDSFAISTGIYNRKCQELESLLLKKKFTKASDQAYFLAHYLFADEVFPEMMANMSYINASMELLLASQDAVTGGFYEDIQKETPENSTGDVEPKEVSLSTTIQVAGVLAQYACLYWESEDAALINACSLAAQRAYRYVEKYREEIELDAWYYASAQLYRLTRQYKYGSAIIEYDTQKNDANNSTTNGYMMLADFTYLSTPYGANYERCEKLLDGYLKKAQDISVRSSREYFYVLPDIEKMSDQEILEDMMLLGVVNRILSGQEYEGAQKNYIHYLMGVNKEGVNYLERMLMENTSEDSVNIGNAVKMYAVYAGLCDT